MWDGLCRCGNHWSLMQCWIGCLKSACEERRKKGPSIDLIPEGICLQGCKSAVESARGEISGIIPSLVCEPAILNVLGALSPALKTFSFAAWGVKTLWDLFLVFFQRCSLKALKCTVWYYFSLKSKSGPSSFILSVCGGSSKKPWCCF